jgi:hypothetical protein
MLACDMGLLSQTIKHANANSETGDANDKKK